MFSSKYYEIFKNTYFEEHLRTIPSAYIFVKPETVIISKVSKPTEKAIKGDCGILQVFYKQFAKSRGKNLCRSLFLVKLQT